jgi:transcriptional regulator NrdR family protein
MPKPTADKQPATQRGLECPDCGCAHFRVLYTRRAWGGRLLRRRACRHCGRRVTTHEKVAVS